MFEDPPKCWLHKQGNFITAFFPEGVEVGKDYDFFYLPGIDPQFGNPYLVAGDIYAMWRDAPEVRAVLRSKLGKPPEAPTPPAATNAPPEKVSSRLVRSGLPRTAATNRAAQPPFGPLSPLLQSEVGP